MATKPKTRKNTVAMKQKNKQHKRTLCILQLAYVKSKKQTHNPIVAVFKLHTNDDDEDNPIVAESFAKEIDPRTAIKLIFASW